MKDVKIRIKKDGSTTLETSGFKGKACEELTDKMLKDLRDLGISGQVKEDKKKAEYYDTASETKETAKY